MSGDWQGRALQFCVEVPTSRTITIQLPAEVPLGAVQVIVLYADVGEPMPCATTVTQPAVVAHQETRDDV